MGLTSQQIHQPFVGVASCWNEAVFKKTPYIADLKPGGRYVAKDMFEVGGIPLLMKTLLDHGFLHGDCITVTGRTIAENLKSVKWNPNQDVVRPANDPITVTGGVVGADHPSGRQGREDQLCGRLIASSLRRRSGFCPGCRPLGDSRARRRDRWTSHHPRRLAESPAPFRPMCRRGRLRPFHALEVLQPRLPCPMPRCRARPLRSRRLAGLKLLLSAVRYRCRRRLHSRRPPSRSRRSRRSGPVPGRCRLAKRKRRWSRSSTPPIRAWWRRNGSSAACTPKDRAWIAPTSRRSSSSAALPTTTRMTLRVRRKRVTCRTRSLRLVTTTRTAFRIRT